MRVADDYTMLRSPWWDDLNWGAELKSVGTIYRPMHYMPTVHGTAAALYTAREAALHHGSGHQATMRWSAKTLRIKEKHEWR